MIGNFPAVFNFNRSTDESNVALMILRYWYNVDWSMANSSLPGRFWARLRAIPDQRLVAGCWLPHWTRRAPAHHTRAASTAGCRRGRPVEMLVVSGLWTSAPRGGRGNVGPAERNLPPRPPFTRMCRASASRYLPSGSFQAPTLTSLVTAAELPVWCRARPKSPVAAPTGCLILACTACQPPVGLARP